MQTVKIPAGKVKLEGNLYVPPEAKGIVLFAHGSGSSRFSPRNQFVAKVLQDAKIATLLFDLLTPEEEKIEEYTREFRFNVELLAERLIFATDWIRQNPETKDLSIGYFGASTGAAAALIAAAKRVDITRAVVSRGGRPDLAQLVLADVKASTLLIVGENDPVVIGMNKEALALLKAEKKLEIVLGATHLFEEPGTLEQAAKLAADWFKKYLSPFAGDHVHAHG